MMNMLATPFYAALLALMYVYLSNLVSNQRRAAQISLGSGNDDILEKRVRAHANFAEFVPLSLLLLWFLEMVTFATNFVNILGALLVVGRILHAYGIISDGTLLFRIWGMVLTYIVIISASLRLLWHYVPL